jgi:hypothetical protein
MLPLLSRKEVTVVFANIEDILLTNTVSYNKPLLKFTLSEVATDSDELSGGKTERVSTVR